MNSLNKVLRRNEQVVLLPEFCPPGYSGLLDRVFVVLSGPGMNDKSAGSAIDGYFLIGEEPAGIRRWHISKNETLEWWHRRHKNTKDDKCEFCIKEISEMIKQVKPMYIVDVEVDLPDGDADLEDKQEGINGTISTHLHVYNSVREEDIEQTVLVAMRPLKDTTWSLRYRVDLHPGSLSSDIKSGGG